MEVPDDASVFSGGGFIGVLKRIPEEDWVVVGSKRCSGRQRLNRLIELSKKYMTDTDYYMYEDFIKKVSSAIREEEIFINVKSSKDLLFKYLTLYDSVSFKCRICEKQKPHSSMYGLMIHIKNAHSKHIEDTYSDLNDDSAYSIYKNAFGPINFKNKKTITPEELSKILESSRGVPVTPAPVPNQNDLFLQAHEEIFDKDSVISDNFIEYLSNDNSSNQEILTTPDELLRAIATIPLLSPPLSPMSMSSQASYSGDYGLPPTPDVHHQQEEADGDNIKKVPIGEESGSSSSSDDSDDDCPKTPQGPLETINEKDIEMEYEKIPLNKPEEKIKTTEYRNTDRTPSISKKNLKMKRSSDSEVSTTTTKRAKLEDSKVAALDVINTEYNIIESDSSSDESIIDREPATRKKKLVSKKKPQAAKSKKTVVKKQTKRIANKSPRPITTSRKIPKANKKSTKQRDEVNTYWATEFVKLLEEGAQDKKLDMQQLNGREDVLDIIQNSINISTSQRKLVKNNNAKIIKDYIAKECNVKTSLDVRDNLAFVSNTKVTADYYNKKTNKTNNPYRASGLVRQLKTFVKFYQDKTNSEVKSEVNDWINTQCENASDIGAWKENIKSLGKIEKATAFSTSLKKLIKKHSQVPEVLPLLKTLSTLKLTETKNGLQYTTSKTDQPKVIKNLINQLIKGSLSNIKQIMSEDDAVKYTDWFGELKSYKGDVSICNNMKWFLNNLVHVFKGYANPMNPFSKISKSDIEKIVNSFASYLMCTDQKIIDEIPTIFTQGFFQNLTIFTMKYIYNIYDRILKLYKLNPATCQQASDFHVGIFHDNNSIKNKCGGGIPQDFSEVYNQYMKNQTTKKGSQINYMGIDRISICLFQMKLISSNLNIHCMDDLIPLLEAENWEVFELIESKCNALVYNQIRSMLYEFLFDLCLNIIKDRCDKSQIFEKKITWDFFKNVLFNSRYYKYPNIVVDVLFDFPTMVFNDNGEAVDAKDPHNCYIYDDSPDAWHKVASRYHNVLFKELYRSVIEDETDDDDDDDLHPNDGILED
ncbi:hypothetical protein HgNV_018 [Homarus gammarus nudivirus]|uniref:Uncharacterized protein n=1 Tax=Homarus gammarus nudivirus TaxID=2509616 RepID=A0A411HB77_9VIRU|nr:hypothetical protein KM727_gp18 [Homarus gammarus nudivirus]QBB28623.1 hypothetical protein HgNV_018 [Homarus gammarus nudivirus]